MDYHQLANFIGERLPGTGVWLHSTPTEETEDQGETGQSCNPLAEGLAIRREDGPGTSPSPSKDRGS
ncbi:MAG: hypothetical protein M3534_17650, partial [Actinomycetota bacterium]|nr:hypothetical protein [Actinomycetota bacterium]